MIAIKKAETSTEIKIIEKLAKQIFHQVYDHIIAAEHTVYFLKKHQTEKAIKNQIEHENFSYYLLNFDSKNAGYLGVQIKNGKLFLSKLYILESFRGLKIGKKALEFVEEFAISNDISKIELWVNQQNTKTITIYKKIGFEILESVVNSFANGHKVNDYIMGKTLPTKLK